MTAKLASRRREPVPSNVIILSKGQATREQEISTEASVRRATTFASRFLKGPVSLPYLCRAARLPGQALAMYLAIRHQVDLVGSPRVRVPTALLEEFGISKDAKSRSLQALASVGLISVFQKPGRIAEIELARETHVRVEV